MRHTRGQQGATFGITPSKLGIIYPVSAIKRLVELVGPAHAKYLLFSGDLIDAATASRLGLISVVVDGEFDAGLDRFVETLLSRSQLAMESMKDIIDIIVAGGDGLGPATTCGSAKWPAATIRQSASKRS